MTQLRPLRAALGPACHSINGELDTSTGKADRVGVVGRRAEDAVKIAGSERFTGEMSSSHQRVVPPQLGEAGEVGVG